MKRLWTRLIKSDFRAGTLCILYSEISWDIFHYTYEQSLQIRCRQEGFGLQKDSSFLGTCFSKTLKSSRLSSWAQFSAQLDETSHVISIAAPDMLDMCCFELWLWLLECESESAKVWSVKLAEGKQDAACQQTSWIRIFGLEILYGL